MRHSIWALLVLVGPGLPACERRGVVPEEPEPHLTLTVETPEALDWGGTGILRVTLSNESADAAEGAIVEVYVPSWLEFGMVEPAGTEVRVVSGDEETRLSYQFPDSLPPGERRTVFQHLRVLYQPPPRPPQDADTVETMQMAPMNQVVRARLLTLDGQPAGAEVQASLHFVGGSATGLPPFVAPPDTLPPTDTLAPPDTVGARTRGTVPDTTPRRN